MINNDRAFPFGELDSVFPELLEAGEVPLLPQLDSNEPILNGHAPLGLSYCFSYLTMLNLGKISLLVPIDQRNNSSSRNYSYISPQNNTKNGLNKKNGSYSSMK
jgi:hypothetical protein